MDPRLGRLGAAAGAPVRTPNLERLAARSTWFARAYGALERAAAD